MRYVNSLVGRAANSVYSDPLLRFFPFLKVWLTGIHIRESGISVGIPVLVKLYREGERRGEFRARCGAAVDVDYRQSGGTVERHLLTDLSVIERYTPVTAPEAAGWMIDIED